MSNITLKGIEALAKNLTYRPNSAKFKAFMAIKSFYTCQEDIEALPAIDTDTLVQGIWDLDSDPAKIRSKRKNFFSLKSAINADLKKLEKSGANPENITISPLNTFDMTEAAKNALLTSFSGAIKTSDMNLDQAKDVLSAITEFLADLNQRPDMKTESRDIVAQLKKILTQINEKDLTIPDGDAEGSEGADGYGDDAETLDEDLEEIELDEDQEILEIDEDGEIEEIDGPTDDLEEIELDEDALDEDIEEIELDENQEIQELDDDQELEEIEEIDGDEMDPDDMETLELDEDEEIQEIDELDEDLEEIELDEDQEIQELDDDQELEEIEEIDGDEMDPDDMETLELDEDEEIQEVDELDEDLEEIELDEDQEIQELDDDQELEEIEEIDGDEMDPADVETLDLDEDEELEEIEELPEDVEELELQEDEDLEEVETLSPEEQAALDAFREQQALAEEFDTSLGEADKQYNTYVKIPKGIYTIGSKKSLKNTLDLAPFEMAELYMGRYPVTNTIFELFIEKTGYVTTAEQKGVGTVYFSRYKRGKKTSFWQKKAGSKEVKGAFWYQPNGPDSSLHGKRHHPVVQVSVEDAMAFAGWIGRRLPTEAEWEAAAGTGNGNAYPWGNLFHIRALNIEESGLADTSPVDEFDIHANEFGLVDMLGNTMEWTMDTQSPPFNTRDSQLYCVAKGGGWNAPSHVTVNSRALFKQDFTANTIGFRCVSEFF